MKGFEYLRLNDDGKSAAGTFEDWPDRVAEITVMDPCCGSGHFLVEAFSMLWQMRAEEEGIALVEAQDAVLRHNLFGLELDARCVQIAMLNVALQAWKAGNGWRQLPVPNIGCSGIPVKASFDEWQALAKGDPRLGRALGRLHMLFRDAETLGSLINPKEASEQVDATGQQSFDDTEWADVAPLLEKALATESADATITVLGADARSMMVAAEELAQKYTLVITNVPYLAKASQSSRLRAFAEERYGIADRDLATVFLQRLREFRADGGFVASVLPQGWLYLASYEHLRRFLLATDRWDLLVRLGPGAFEGISGEVVNVCLLVASDGSPDASHMIVGLDSSTVAKPGNKARACRGQLLEQASQLEQLAHRGARFSFEQLSGHGLLADYADSYQGLKTGDNPRFARCYWEVPDLGRDWVLLQSSVNDTCAWGGRSQVLWWREDGTELKGSEQARVQGTGAWNRVGVVVREMKSLPATLYSGDVFESSGIAIVPRRASDLSAVWAFCSSRDFNVAVRRIDQKLGVATATVTQVPFDVEHWRQVAMDLGPLPEAWSDDPTQWLFEGRPEVSNIALQVAVGRLVGYHWPKQAESDDLNAFADADGIVCLPAVAGEPPAADRLQLLLAAAFGDFWSSAKVKELLEQAGSKKKSLADWLREEFFKQHCSLFGNRPFVWHIWDGQRDGFSAFVNYHRLDRKTLEKLTYTYLGQDWVERQRAEVRDGVAGAEARLAAALGLQKRLEAVLEGEAPLDIYVRWKEIHEQPIGWEPDLNDGVRLNIRPLMEAGVLRSSFNIHWRKDRGRNPDGTERFNDVHRTLAEKIEARKGVGQA